MGVALKRQKLQKKKKKKKGMGEGISKLSKTLVLLKSRGFLFLPLGLCLVEGGCSMFADGLADCLGAAEVLLERNSCFSLCPPAVRILVLSTESQKM